MGRSYLVVAVLVGFLCVGCGQDENKTTMVNENRPLVQEQEQVFAPEGMNKINQVAGSAFQKDSDVDVEAKKRAAQFAAAVQEEAVAVKENQASTLKAEEEKAQQPKD